VEPRLYTELTHDQRRITDTEVARATDRQEPILKSYAWQNYATMSKLGLTSKINQEKSPTIPSTNTENKHSVHHRICIKVRKTVTDQALQISRDGRPAEYRWRPLLNAAKFG